MKRFEEDKRMRRRGRERNIRKRKVEYETDEGLDFTGVQDILTYEPTLEGRWQIFSNQPMTPTNLCIFEYADVARQLAVAAFAMFKVGERIPAEDPITRDCVPVYQRLKTCWLTGLPKNEAKDDELEYLVWVSLIGVAAIKTYRERLEVREVEPVLYERGIAVVKKSVDKWFLRDIVESIVHLVRIWPDIELDETVTRYIKDIFITYCNLQTALFGRKTEPVNYEGYVDPVETEMGPAARVNKDFDKIMYAVMRDMRIALRQRKLMRKSFYSINLAEPIDKETEVCIYRWMSLRGVEESTSAVSVVLKRMRTWFFWYYRRPGAERRHRMTLEVMGEEVANNGQQTFDAQLGEAELEFSMLFSEESSAFTKRFFDCDMSYVQGCRGEPGFGRQVYNLVFLLGFAHTMDMHTGIHFFDDYFVNNPSETMFSRREEKNRVLLVRRSGEYYVVETQYMHATQCADIKSGVRTWMDIFLSESTNPTIIERVGDLRDQIFTAGVYELRSKRREAGSTMSKSIIPPHLLSRICSNLNE